MTGGIDIESRDQTELDNIGQDGSARASSLINTARAVRGAGLALTSLSIEELVGSTALAHWVQLEAGSADGTVSRVGARLTVGRASLALSEAFREVVGRASRARAVSKEAGAIGTLEARGGRGAVSAAGRASTAAVASLVKEVASRAALAVHQVETRAAGLAVSGIHALKTVDRAGGAIVFANGELTSGADEAVAIEHRATGETLDALSRIGTHGTVGLASGAAVAGEVEEVASRAALAVGQ